MKTIVYQAFCGHRPAWIDRCTASVQQWAKENQYDYRFIGDEMLDYVPQWYRDKVGDQIPLFADLARLKLARGFLSKEFTRTIWIDADIIIFDTEKFNIDGHGSYAFGREVWCDLSSRGQLLFDERVNNGVLIFTRRSRLILELYILAFLINVKKRKKKQIPFNVHIQFLTKVYKYINIPLLTNVGQFSPAVMDIIFRNNDPLLKQYMKSFEFPIYASNLSHSFRNKNYFGITLNDDMYEKVIDRLLETKGVFLNHSHQMTRI